MEKMIDLHIHTVYSDGTCTPFEIVDEAVKNGVGVISITDHDTIDAYSDSLFDYAKEKNVELIKGVEISTKAKRSGIHVLGYNIDLDNENLKEFLYRIRNARHIYLHDVSKKLKELGYVVDEEKLDKIDSVTKAHIANDIIHNKENTALLMKNFHHIPNMGEFIETIMNEDCPAYVKKAVATPEETSRIIREAGGKVVLAHPVAYTYEDDLNIKDMKSIIEEMEADGVEANYIYYDRENKRHDDVEKWRKFARDNGLFETVGSDFHTKDGIHPVIGLMNENFKLSTYRKNKIYNSLAEDSKIKVA